MNLLDKWCLDNREPAVGIIYSKFHIYSIVEVVSNISFLG